MPASPRHTSLALRAAAAAVAAALPLIAAAEAEVTSADPVVVSASRNPQPLSQTSASMAVVTSDEISEKGASTLGQILQDLPNVQVTDADNPLFTRVQIRGADESQITWIVDGVRQDMTTLAGNHPYGAWIDPELVQQVEVRNGGGSALWGNGGIGGTIAVTTKKARDLLREGETFGVLARTGYSSVSREWQASASAFGAAGNVDWLFGFSHRRGSELHLADGKGRIDDGTESVSDTFHAKVSVTPTDESEISLGYTYDDFDYSYNYDADPAQPMSYGYLQHRVTAGYDWADYRLWDLKVRAQYTRSDNKMDQIIGAGMGQGNEDAYTAWSGSVQNTSRFEAFSSHSLTYGVDYAVSKQTSLTYNPYVSSPVADGSRPDSRARDAGVFVEDEIRITDWLTAAPRLRWSHFEREALLGDYADSSDSHWSPGLTLRVTPHGAVSFWASASSGFRPPMLDELYYSQAAIPGLTTGKAVANPDLKPETSWNYELGVSASFADLLAEGDRTTVRAAAFYDKIKDFITIDQWTDPEDGSDCWQAVNFGRVTRKGAELQASYAAGSFSAKASWGLVHATDEETGERIAGIAPQTATLRLAYEVKGIGLTPWWRVVWNDSADGVRSSGSHAEYDSFTTHSLGVTWAPSVPGFWDFTAGLAVDNLFDEEYRYAGGSWGHARSLRAWMTGRF